MDTVLAGLIKRKYNVKVELISNINVLSTQNASQIVIAENKELIDFCKISKIKCIDYNDKKEYKKFISSINSFVFRVLFVAYILPAILALLTLVFIYIDNYTASTVLFISIMIDLICDYLFYKSCKMNKKN